MTSSSPTDHMKSVWRLLCSYPTLVRENSGLVTAVEDFVKAATVFIPGRFSAAELRGEGVYTFINIISMYHDHILERYQNRLPEIHCVQETPLTRRLKTMLMVLRHSQVFLEMLAVRHYTTATTTMKKESTTTTGSMWRFIATTKWGMILLMEVTKAIIVLYLWRQNHYRMLVVDGSQQQAARHARDRMHSILHKQQQQQQQQQHSGDGSGEEEEKFPELRRMYEMHGRGSHTPNPAAPRSATPHPHGCFSVLTNPMETRDLYDETRAVTAQSPSPEEMLGEVLHIARPLVYVLAVCRLQQSQPRSWTPWLLALFTDIASRILSTRHRSSLTSGQRGELARRLSQWLYYLARSPMYERFCMPPLIGLFGLLSRIPLIGFVFSSGIDLVQWVPTYYMYTSASH